MIDCTLRTLPSGGESVLSLPGVPSAGSWLRLADGSVVAVDLVLFEPAGLLLVGHVVGASLAAERLGKGGD